MPQIIVVADNGRERPEDAVMLRERISASDLQSQHFALQLLERLEWAVGDAHQVERDRPRDTATVDDAAAMDASYGEAPELVGSPH